MFRVNWLQNRESKTDAETRSDHTPMRTSVYDCGRESLFFPSAISAVSTAIKRASRQHHRRRTRFQTGRFPVQVSRLSGRTPVLLLNFSISSFLSIYNFFTTFTFLFDRRVNHNEKRIHKSRELTRQGKTRKTYSLQEKVSTNLSLKLHERSSRVGVYSSHPVMKMANGV